MPKDSSGAGVRVSWSPELTLKLLKFIKGEKYYRQVFFPRSSTLPKDRHLYARAAVMEFFEKVEWMRDAERRGLANWDVSEKEWRPTTAWGSHISNPINCRVNLLKQRMSDRYYKRQYQIADSSTSFDDIPSASKRATFRKLHPYYFVLKELCERGEKKCRAEALELRDMPKADSGKGQRRKRSPSILSDSSCSSSSSVGSDSNDTSTCFSNEDSGSSIQPTHTMKRFKTERCSSVPAAAVESGFGLIDESSPKPLKGILDNNTSPIPADTLRSKSENQRTSSLCDTEDSESQSSASSSVIFLSSRPKALWSPEIHETTPSKQEKKPSKRVVPGSITEGPKIGPSAGQKVELVSARSAHEDNQASPEDAKLITAWKEIRGRWIVDPKYLTSRVTIELYIGSNNPSTSIGYLGDIVDWLGRHPGYEAYLHSRARLELGVETLDRRLRNNPSSNHLLREYKIYIPQPYLDEPIVVKLVGCLRSAGAKVYHVLPAFQKCGLYKSFQLTSRLYPGQKLYIRAPLCTFWNFHECAHRIYEMCTAQYHAHGNLTSQEITQELQDFKTICTGPTFYDRIEDIPGEKDPQTRIHLDVDPKKPGDYSKSVVDGVTIMTPLYFIKWFNQLRERQRTEKRQQKRWSRLGLGNVNPKRT
ncbi:uncharacterized protein L199_002077 [Kwoniella botswanensis]|uniref:uncharacterized protein n=1 Tax=Kwoniella botswanensis TaxID=1268659 RepID=UPI00315D0367